MKRLVYVFIFAIVPCGAHLNNDHTLRERSFISEQENAWQLLEEIIIKHPRRSVSKLMGKKGATLLSAGGVGILGYLASKYLTGNSSNLLKACSLGAGILTGAVTYQSLKSFLLSQEEHRQLRKLMKCWEQAREQIPTEVRKILDELYVSWQADGEGYNEQAADALSLVKAELRHKYWHKYTKEPEPFFSSRQLPVRLTLDIQQALKSLWSLGLALIDDH